jgi:hypothetical protein
MIRGTVLFVSLCRSAIPLFVSPLPHLGPGPQSCVARLSLAL